MSDLKVLIVEDDPVTLTVFTKIVKEEGYDVTSCPDAESAWEEYQQNKFAICFLDWQLPGMDGLTLCRKIRHLDGHNRSYVLMITARNETDDLRQVLESGADDYLSKPASAESLRVRLKIAEMQYFSRLRRFEAEKTNLMMQQVFDNSFEAIVIVNPALETLYTNRAYTRITGYESDEIAGKIPRILQDEDKNLESIESIFYTVRASGQWQGEVWDVRKSGELYPAWLTISIVTDEQNIISHYVCFFTDISSSKKTEERLRFITTHDSLTKLPNRGHIADILEHAVLQARRNETMIGVLFLDIDHFKMINDSLSHSAGDELLLSMTNMLKNILNREDSLARTGGDEFVMILENIDNIERPIAICNAISKRLNNSFVVQGQEVFVTASIGIALYPADGDSADTLLQNADIAMYRAKEGGRNNYQFYTSEMNTRVFERMTLETSLRKAIDSDQFVMYFQPQIDVNSGRIIALEALIRWQHPDMGLVSPARFIPVAEETGLIIGIGRWVFQQVCRFIITMKKEHHIELPVAVNVSAKQFFTGDFLETIEALLEETGVDARLLEVEMTESLFMADVEVVNSILHRLKELGLTIAIDDFGTGYSSLNYLKKFPVDVLKVDQSFVRDVVRDNDDAAIVRAMVNLAHNLGMKVIAEGVEEKEQIEFLRSAGCDMLQGYFFSRPVDADSIVKVLEKKFISD